MKMLMKLLIAGVAMLSIAPLAHADSSDQISFAGFESYCTTTTTSCNAGDVKYAAQSASGNVQTGGAYGVFSAFNGAATNFNNFNYITQANSSFVLFTSTNSSNATLKFTVTSLTSTSTSKGLEITGTGFYTYTSAAGVVTTYQNGSFDMTTQGSGSGATTTFSDTNTITPEPSSLLLLGTGLVAAAGLLFQRRRLGNAGPVGAAL